VADTADDPYLTVAEIAKKLKVTNQTVYDWLEKGHFPSIRLGRAVRVRREDLDAWLNRREVGTVGSGDPSAEGELGTAATGVGEAADAATRTLKADAQNELRAATDAWAGAMRAHKLAPPDLGFSSRLRELSRAAELEQQACERLVAAGLRLRAQPAEPPYELRPNTGRRGPADLWEHFDGCVYRLNHAIEDGDPAEVAAAFGDLSASAARLADAVDEEDRGAVRGSGRGARGAA
jgi:excisionase family DNA binding protein